MNGGHEDLERHIEVRLSSDRSFGLVFAVFFSLIGLWPLWRGGPIRIWSLVVSAIFLVAALLSPRILRPLNKAWSRFGLLLGRIISPIVLALMFFLLFTPGALLFRILRKDLLLLKRTSGDTYWIRRTPPGPSPETIVNQF
jgi:hypothetical protein